MTDGPARLAWLLARAGAEGLSLEAICADLQCGKDTFHRHVNRAREAGWPIEAVHVGDTMRATYRLRGYHALQSLDGAEPEPDVRPSRSRANGRRPGPMSQRIDELAAQGLSAAEIRQQTGASHGQVHSRLWALRVSGKAPPPQPRSRSVLTPGGRPERIRDMTLAGASAEEIAAAVETTVSTVRATVNRLRKDGHLPPSSDTPRRGRPRVTVAQPGPPG